MQLGKVRVAQQLVNGDVRRDRKNVFLRAPAGRMLRVLDLDLVRSVALMAMACFGACHAFPSEFAFVPHWSRPGLGPCESYAVEARRLGLTFPRRL
jgi:hypothetical protein